MSEETPLSPGEEYYYVDVEDTGFLPPCLKQNAYLKYTVFLISGLCLFLFLYFMVVFLPNLAPEGVKIPNIQMVDESKFYLHPIYPEKNKFKNPDPMDPVKVVPKFREMDYVSDENPTIKKHLQKLNNLSKLGLNNKPMKKRLILVGDIHGCLNQLKNLLNKVNYDGGVDDQVLLLGDFLNKGPKSIELLDFAIDNNLDCILGNHELAMLKRYSQFHGIKPPVFLNDKKFNNSTLSIRESYDLDDLMKIAKKITPNHISFLSKCSPIKEIGPVPHYINKRQSRHSIYAANGIAVHAGLVWNKGLHEQDVEEVTTIRNLLPPDWKIPTDDRHDKVGGKKSQAWTKIWNQKQTNNYTETLENLNGDEFTIGTKVYYGHDAKRGVKIKEFSNGLDSGCVYGKQLTGIIIWSQYHEQNDNVFYKQMEVQVNC